MIGPNEHSTDFCLAAGASVLPDFPRDLAIDEYRRLASRFAVVISIGPQNESSYGVWVARNISAPLREHIPSAPSKIELYSSRADGLLKGGRQLRQGRLVGGS
jgi:hypothetical protein